MLSLKETGGRVVLLVNRLEFSLDPSSLSILSLRRDGEAWINRDGPGALWTLSVVDSGGHRVTLAPEHAARSAWDCKDDEAVLRWEGLAHKEASGFDVEVTVRTGGGEAAALWRIAVQNRSETFTLWSVRFPIVPGIKPLDEAGDRMLWPTGFGVERWGWDSFQEPLGEYPAGAVTAMQFIGLSRGSRTLYLAPLDPTGRRKDFCAHLHRPPAALALDLSILGFPEMIGHAGNAFRAEFDTEVGILDGDWYDLAKRYGSWARGQWGVAEAAVRPSREKLLRTQLWCQLTTEDLDCPLSEQVEKTISLRDALDAPVAVQLYNWHVIPFDTDYPDYFPVRPGVPEIVERLERAGIPVLPYINARLWDPCSPSWEAEGAQRWCVKRSAERVGARTLMPPTEEYGNGQHFVPMCPATEFWQEKVARICERIRSELGTSGVYLDQVAAMYAPLCFDPAHPHAPGGGHYWTDGYSAMMRRVRELAGEDGIYTTECNAETCAGDFDALLTWHASWEPQVPMFPAAYGSLAPCFGTNAGPVDYEDGGESFAFKQAQLYVWGAQLGWSGMLPLLEPGNAHLLEFTKALCAARMQAADALRGEMLRPPVINTRARPARLHWGGGRGRYHQPMGPLLGSLWQTQAGEPWMLLANPTRRDIKASTTVAADALAGRRLTVRHPFALDSVQRGGRLITEWQLPPLSVAAAPLPGDG